MLCMYAINQFSREKKSKDKPSVDPLRFEIEHISYAYILFFFLNRIKAYNQFKILTYTKIT